MKMLLIKIKLDGWNGNVLPGCYAVKDGCLSEGKFYRATIRPIMLHDSEC